MIGVFVARLLVRGRREEAFAVTFAEQEREAGEAVAQRLGAVGLAADEALEGLADQAAVGCEPVVQELAEFDGYLEPSRQLVLCGLPRSRTTGPGCCGWPGRTCRLPICGGHGDVECGTVAHLSYPQGLIFANHLAISGIN